MVQQPLEVLVQCVTILFDETGYAVNDITGVMRNTEIFSMLQFFVHWLQLSAAVMRMMGQFLIHCIQQCFVGNFTNRKACFVHYGNDALVRLFDEVANYLLKGL